MSLTPSNMLPLGTEAPDFELWDTVSNSTKTLNKLKGSTRHISYCLSVIIVRL